MLRDREPFKSALNPAMFHSRSCVFTIYVRGDINLYERSFSFSFHKDETDKIYDALTYLLDKALYGDPKIDDLFVEGKRVFLNSSFSKFVSYNFDDLVLSLRYNPELLARVTTFIMNHPRNAELFKYRHHRRPEYGYQCIPYAPKLKSDIDYRIMLSTHPEGDEELLKHLKHYSVRLFKSKPKAGFFNRLCGAVEIETVLDPTAKATPKYEVIDGLDNVLKNNEEFIKNHKK